MDLVTFWKLFKKRKKAVFFFVIAFLAIAVILVVTQTFKYGSSSRLLISQSFSPNTDAYSISRTNDYLGNLFAQVVDSNSFYEDVLETGFNVDKEYFTQEKNFSRLMDKWQDTVKVNPSRDGSGIIGVKVYHPDKEQVRQISEAVNYVIRTQNQDYHGLGDQVFVRVIDRPSVSTYPVKPNIFLIFPLALLLGLAVSLLYVYFIPEKEEEKEEEMENKEEKKKNKEDEEVKEEDRKAEESKSGWFAPEDKRESEVFFQDGREE